MLCYKFENSKKEWLVAVWKITETIEELSSLVADEALLRYAYNNFKGERLGEWLATRALLKVLLGCSAAIEYDSSGKPFVNSGHYISISHTKGFVAIALSRSQEIGLDIELADRDSLAVCRRYMSCGELEQLQSDDAQRVALLNWLAKEALFKIVGNVGGTFRDNIFVQPFVCADKGILQLSLKDIYSDEVNFVAEYFSFDSLILLVCRPASAC